MDRDAGKRRFLGRSYKIFLPLLVLILMTACVPQTTLSQPDSTQAGIASTQVGQTSGKDMINLEQGQALQIRSIINLINGSAPSPLQDPEYQLELIDLGSGEPVKSVQPIFLGSNVTSTYSPDYTQLAIISKGAGCIVFCLRIFNLKNFEQTVLVDIPKLGSQGYVSQSEFDQSGKRLAIAFNEYNQGYLSLVDISRQESPVLQTTLFPYSPSLLAFTADGTKIITVAHLLQENFSTPAELTPRLHAISVDADTLRITWDQAISEVNDGFYGSQDSAKFEESIYYQAGITAGASSQKIFIAHADADKLTTVDFKAQSLKTVTIHEKRTWLENLIVSVLSIGVRDVQAKAGNMFVRQALLSTDGQTLYVVGYHDSMVQKADENWETIHTADGLAAWDIANSTIRVTADTDASEIYQGLSGEIILNGYKHNSSTYQPFTEIFDPSSGEIIARLDHSRAYPSLRTDGTPVLVSSESNDIGDTFLAVYKDNAGKPELLWSHKVSSMFAYWPEYR